MSIDLKYMGLTMLSCYDICLQIGKMLKRRQYIIAHKSSL